LIFPLGNDGGNETLENQSSTGLPTCYQRRLAATLTIEMMRRLETLIGTI